MFKEIHAQIQCCTREILNSNKPSLYRGLHPGAGCWAIRNPSAVGKEGDSVTLGTSGGLPSPNPGVQEGRILTSHRRPVSQALWQKV